MKNKLGIISLVLSAIPWVLIYSSTKIKLGRFGFIFMTGNVVPFIIACILILSLLSFLCIFSAASSLKSKEGFKGYPILALIIISPIILLTIWLITFFIQGIIRL